MIGAYVLDVSVTLAWCFANEATPVSDALLRESASAIIHVPGLWHIELANVLLQAERRRRLTAAQVSDFLQLLAGLEIETDLEHMDGPSLPLLELARRHELTTYDATYLALAIRLGIPIATRDKALIRAGGATGAEVVPT